MSHRDYVLLAFDKLFSAPQLKNKTLLDVGCRGNAMKGKLEERGVIWTGLDISPQGGADKGDMCAMPYTDKKFDIIFACHSLEHVETPLTALREFKRVMKDDGVMFIATPNPCEHQITKGDPDHIFVMNVMQMEKWLEYVKINKIGCYLQTEGVPREQDYNVITVGRKPKEKE